jgi:uncharacterized protein YegP (UPF0339 family)
MPAKYELKTTQKGKFVFNLKAGNGEVILNSEVYEDRTGAVNAIKSVQKNGGKGSNFEIRTAQDGQNYFILVASNREIIGRSEMYKTMAGAKRGVASVMRNSHAPVVEVKAAS